MVLVPCFFDLNGSEWTGFVLFQFTHPPYFAGRGLTIVGSILEGDFNERADDVALAKEVRANQYFGQKHFMLQFSDFP